LSIEFYHSDIFIFEEIRNIYSFRYLENRNKILSKNNNIKKTDRILKNETNFKEKTKTIFLDEETDKTKEYEIKIINIGKIH